MRRLLTVLALALGLGLGAVPATARAAEPPPLVPVSPPSVDGVARYGRTLVAAPGSWAPGAARVRYEWRREGTPVGTGRRYAVQPADVGHRLTLVVTASAPGYADTPVQVATPRIKHRVDVRRTVRYSVRVKGRLGPGADVAAFRRLAQETYDDARGWRAKGVRFVQVRRGGAFTLWLSEASRVPGFSSVCSAQWSCRVGRNVVINVERWQHASPAWNRLGRSLRDYRHMVVNHETGHWLGRGHASCPRAGALAPVMMQQSKGLHGCRANPWPTPRELRRR
ncbi:DUF3152 domain-containing protein [Pimelobacter simplex]|uniref:Membrane protein n=1 Tax=Nocardioides simplex TaxID=2045 RepID=A0A0C5WY58_NOCSI|nr:DUF3152 domain-containing protein [Pimelobacter simplex]AJR18238.1 membrane protein [Pimelobacter simplex]MCG8154210.1 DUF3152 domain-containing protein [Pimelobacter simplex]GEB15619.1 hypothetical protein NSI01_39340 [Pimelobacter simplex]SFM57521.1 Protein of unknown function [Pimelobacter simplex]